MAALLLDGERVLGDWCYITDGGVQYLYRMGLENPDNASGSYESITTDTNHMEPLAQAWLEEQLNFTLDSCDDEA